ncbi:protein of unknown function [Tenacibaculum sp. 190524A02b]|uniref:amino acid adenylation domain-containing protein n=1 Tax=Tenacibaculum vairaonense TaxID=3137860 RepID=UPI0032B13A69
MQEIKEIQAINLLENKISTVSSLPQFNKRKQPVSIEYTILGTNNELEKFYKFSNDSEKLEYLLLVSFIVLSYKHMFGSIPFVKSILKQVDSLNELPIALTEIAIGNSVKETIKTIEKNFQEDALILHDNEFFKNKYFKETVQKLLHSEKGVVFHYHNYTQEIASNNEVFSILIDKQEKGLHCNVSSFSNQVDEAQLYGYVYLLEAYLKDIENQLGKTHEKPPKLYKKHFLEMLHIGRGKTIELPSKSIIEQFIDQVQKTPLKTALNFNGKKWSYKELHERSNKIANVLHQKYNVNYGDKVGVLLQRNEYLILSLLAIHKAGASYIPLDVNYPEDRIKFIYKDSGVDILLVNVGQIYQAIEPTNLIAIETLESNELDNSILLNIKKQCEDFYVVYTSGSTGLPKGCQITQKNVTNLCEWAKDQYNTNEFSNILASTSICFDLSIFEIFLPLTIGGTVVLVENIMELMTMEKLPEISLINSIPSLVQELVNNHKLPKNLEVINLAGEPIQESLIHQLHAEQNNVKKVWNLYGPSETTTYSTGKQFAKDNFEGNCIGKPIYNTTTLVLNEDFQPVPYGYPGELFIGGTGVSNGYWNRPELNNEKFITIPEAEEQGIFYKTGDIVTWKHDQTLKFLGRSDTQVKIRGFRIELNEIEQALSQHDQIQQIKVFVQGANNNAKIIACYQSEQEISHKALYTHCLQVIPKYMIPQEFIYFKDIFRTPNGKIDTKRLKEFCGRKNVSELNNNSSNETLNKLLNIIGTIANKKIVPTMNLYEVGFSSIDFIKLLVRIEKDFGVSIKINELFEEATPIAISESIKLNYGKQKEPLRRASKKELYPATFSQERFWLNTKFNKEKPELFHIPSIIKWNKALDLVRLEQAWNTLLEKNEILRTNFIYEKEQLFQKINIFTPVTIEVDYIKDVNLSEVYKTSFFTSGKNLEQDALANIKVIQEAESLFYILFNFHHSIIDGWSLELIFKKLLKYYHESEENKSGQYQFKDYSEYYHQKLLNKSKEKEYWKQKLNLIKEPLQLFDSKKEKSTIGGTHIATLGTIKFKELTKVFREHHSSLFQGIASILGVLFRRYGNEKNIMVGMPSANRPFEVLEDIPGLFLDVLFFHLSLDENIPFSNLLKKTKTEITESIANQEFPLDALLKENSHKNKGDFDVFIAYQQYGNFQQKKLENNVEVISCPIKYAKHPLSIYFYEKAENLEFFIEYQKDKISDNEVVRLWKHFEKIIDVVINDANILIDNISILDKEEEKDIQKFEVGIKEDILPFTLFELFEKNIHRNVFKNAIHHKEAEYSYAYCNQYAKIIHEALVQKDISISEEKLVIAIDLPNGVGRVAAILGVLRHGGIVLPIQPDFPLERKKVILEEAKVSICITDALSEIYTEDKSVLLPKYSDKKISIPKVKVHSEEGAWLIFTSGSTGKPKGVLLSHENIVNMLFWFADYFQLGNKSVFPQKTNISFVDSIAEFLIPLCITSGTVYLRPEEGIVKNTEALNIWLKNIQVTHIQFVPEIFDHFYSQIQSIPESLNHLLLSGNKITSYHDLTCKLYNVYGASETTAYTLVKQIQEKEEIKSIGNPVCNTTIKIINDSGKRVPIGIKGELYIKGKLIFNGYINQEEQPFVLDVSHKKWYRTNDVVSWDENGNVIFHGRKGNVVKVKGVRIDLSEIEAVTSAIFGVQTAIAKVLEEEENNILVVFLHTSQNITLKEIQEVVKKEIPSYAQPTAYRLIREIPFNTSGKVNKKELNLSYGEVPKSGYVYVAHQTETEKVLTNMIKELIKLEEVSVEDNYFDLGIDSMNLIKLEKLVSETFFKVAITDFFTYTSIRSLAEFIDNKGITKSIDFTLWENEFTAETKRSLTNDVYDELTVNINEENCEILENLCQQYQVKQAKLINAFACYGLANILEKEAINYAFIENDIVSSLQLSFTEIQTKEEFIHTFLNSFKADNAKLQYAIENIRVENYQRSDHGLIMVSVQENADSETVQSVFDILIKTSKSQINILWREAYIPEEICLDLVDMIMSIIESFAEVENPQ